MPLYRVRFYRWNSHVSPEIRQESDVIFVTDEELFSEDFDKAMYEALWLQNPMWLNPHGPREIGFQGWSSVMFDRETLKILNRKPSSIKEDLTGDGNQLVPMTYHPLLPDDMRVSLRRAYERGLVDGKSTTNVKDEREENIK